MFHPDQETFNKLRGLDFDGYGVPDHTKLCLENYFYHGLQPGSFMTAMLRGDYEFAANLADEQNWRSIDEIRRFIEEQIPEDIRGNDRNMRAWIYGTRSSRTSTSGINEEKLPVDVPDFGAIVAGQ